MSRVSRLAVSLAFATTLATAAAETYVNQQGWMKLPPGVEQLGDQHGDIAVSSAGEIYVSLMDPNAGIRVFAADGTFLRNVPNAPNDFHGFVIRKLADGEHIYGPRLSGQSIVKMTLDGKIVMEVPASAIPDQFKKAAAAPKKGEKAPKETPKPSVRLTGMDVAPNGDWYVTDGYSSDYVHHFDKNGKYIKSFGGKEAPYNFKTLHKIAVDTRFNPPRILALDRSNMRAVHMKLDGEFLGVVATDLLAPSAVRVQGEYALIGELRGRAVVLDKSGAVVARVGANDHKDEIGTNKTVPAKWRPGIINAAHGVAFDAKGNIYISEWTNFGRVHRFNRE